jgi:hypothetical protein
VVRIIARLFVPLLLGCPGVVTPPGDEQMGRYEMEATPRADDCAFSEVPDGGFAFEVYFSRYKSPGSQSYITLGGVPHDAMFDGQVISGSYAAQRNFADCLSCNPDGGLTVVTMTETLSATIVSKSQSDAVKGCVVSPPVDPDAGITRPGTTDTGFDAVRACGRLTEQVSIDIATPRTGGVDAGCSPRCVACSLAYDITGDRK